MLLPMAALVLTSAACGNTEKKADPAPSSSYSAVSAASQTPSAPASETAPSEAAASESPATDASGQASSGTSESASAAAVITGEGYTYDIPAGWEDASAKVKSSGLDSAILNGTDTDGFADNMNVQVLPVTGKLTTQQLEVEVKRLLAEQKITDIKTQTGGSVDGEEAVAGSGVLSSNGNKNKVLAILTVHGGKAYAITCSYDTKTSGDKAEAEFTPIIDSWKWTS